MNKQAKISFWLGAVAGYLAAVLIIAGYFLISFLLVQTGEISLWHFEYKIILFDAPFHIQHQAILTGASFITKVLIIAGIVLTFVGINWYRNKLIYTNIHSGQ